MSSPFDLSRVRAYLTDLQTRMCGEIEEIDGTGRFQSDAWKRAEGGGGLTRVLTEGTVFEKAGVGFSDVTGAQLPPSASAHRPELAGKNWEGMGVSAVFHPRNPYAPTSHVNVRCFVAGAESDQPIWWFGGGFDLTPYYGFAEDAIQWHRTARAALAPHGPEFYPKFKEWCDRYFFLKHRAEPRGIGGIFFDDFNALDFERSFALLRSVGDSFIQAYRPIVERRHREPYEDRQRQFQLYRRGRYVEFNLVWDRGTLFGLQSGGRTESILMSLPPLVRWDYAWQPEAGSPEARLTEDFLQPRNWAELDPREFTDTPRSR